MPKSFSRVWLPVLLASALLPILGRSAALPSSPDSYLRQTAQVRRAQDRPWMPDAGKLGNLRHLQITARDCTVRVVSGTENRVIPGTRDVLIVEQSRVLDAEPNEQPPPRDVVLAPDRAQACPSVGSCGVSITSVTRAPVGAAGSVCFTVQIATAHDLLIGGDGLSLLVDHLRQPALRIALNPSAGLRLWLEQVNLGLLSINANAAADVGGTGEIDFLSAGSSNSASRMFLHGFHAHHVGISTTTTGTRWSISIADDTKAGYYQPARGARPLAKNYPIEIDGPIERLEVPAAQVDPHPLGEDTRLAARVLHDDVLMHAGTAPSLPSADTTLRSASAAATAPLRDPQQHLADVVARYLPASIKITHVALWKQGGRLEGIAPDADTARDVAKRLTNSGEFTYVSGGGGISRDGGYAFSTQLNFSCEAPGEPSACPAGDPITGAYSDAQVHDRLRALLGPSITLRAVRLVDSTIHMEADAPNEMEARAGLDRIGHENDLFRLSSSGYRPTHNPAGAEITATLKLTCAVPPKADGICAARN